VPVNSLSQSSSPKDVGLFVLDSKTDEGKRSEAFFCVKVSCMKGEEVEGICICTDP
jgi:hypothetical protein